MARGSHAVRGLRLHRHELGMAKNGLHGWRQKREEGEAGKGERRKRSRDLGRGRHGKAKSHGRAL